jgi:hypothetical protein
MSQRDTQFLQGFAKLLWDEMVEANRYGYIDVNKDDSPTDPTDYLTVIARRAYDLVLYSQQFMPGIENVPDIQSWDDL